MWQDGLTSSGLAEAGARHGPGEVSYRRKVLERIADLPDADYRVLERRRA